MDRLVMRRGTPGRLAGAAGAWLLFFAGPAMADPVECLWNALPAEKREIVVASSEWEAFTNEDFERGRVACKLSDAEFGAVVGGTAGYASEMRGVRWFSTRGISQAQLEAAFEEVRPGVRAAMAIEVLDQRANALRPLIARFLARIGVGKDDEANGGGRAAVYYLAGRDMRLNYRVATVS